MKHEPRGGPLNTLQIFVFMLNSSPQLLALNLLCHDYSCRFSSEQFQKLAPNVRVQIPREAFLVV